MCARARNVNVKLATLGRRHDTIVGGSTDGKGFRRAVEAMPSNKLTLASHSMVQGRYRLMPTARLVLANYSILYILNPSLSTPYPWVIP